VADTESGSLSTSTIFVRDSTTGAIVVTCAHVGHISSVTFSPDSKRILSASCDHTVRVRILNILPVDIL